MLDKLPPGIDGKNEMFLSDFFSLKLVVIFSEIFLRAALLKELLFSIPRYKTAVSISKQTAIDGHLLAGCILLYMLYQIFLDGTIRNSSVLSFKKSSKSSL